MRIETKCNSYEAHATGFIYLSPGDTFLIELGLSVELPRDFEDAKVPILHTNLKSRGNLKYDSYIRKRLLPRDLGATTLIL